MVFPTLKFFQKKLTKVAIGGILSLALAYLIPSKSSMAELITTALFIVGLGVLIVVVLVLLYRFLSFLSGRVFFRVRNRIIAHYVLVGLLPLLLLALLFYVGGYFFMLQLISFHLTDLVEDDAKQLRVIAQSFAVRAVDQRKNPEMAMAALGDLLDEMRRDFSELEVIWYRQANTTDSGPDIRWSSMQQPPPFSAIDHETLTSFLVANDNIYLVGRALFISDGEPMVMLVYVPAMGDYRVGLAEKFEGDIFFSYGLNTKESLQVIEPKIAHNEDTTTPGPTPTPTGFKINFSTESNKSGIQIEGINTWADEWYENAQGGFGHLVSYSVRPALLVATDATTIDEITVIVLVSTRYVKMIATFIQGAVPENIPMQKVLFWVIVILAGLFAFIELIAIIISLVLSRSITSMIAQLHQKTKLISQGSFQYRIDSPRKDQLGELARSFDKMSDDLVKLLAEVKEKERLEHELLIAQEVQRTFFPQTTPTVNNIQILGKCLPARMVSGDYYDFLDHGDFLDFYIGDISGKGISAALLMAGSQTFLKIEATKRPLEPIAEIVAAYNNYLCATTKDGRFSTLFYARLNKTTREMIWCNGGHLHPILFRQGELLRLAEGGMVPGVVPKQIYSEGSITLDENDLLVAFTDGFTEVFDHEQEEFGEERLANFLTSVKYEKPGEIYRLLVDKLNSWAGTAEQADDMTILLLQATSKG